LPLLVLSSFGVAVARFLVVIPEGNLRSPLSLLLFSLSFRSVAKESAVVVALAVAVAVAVALAFLSVIPEGNLLAIHGLSHTG
jgi:hypothetical protein